MRTRLGRKSRQQRWGAAAVEMAAVTPLLLTMLFGIIEYGWVFSVRQTLVNAAREGARTASLPGSTEQEVMDRVTDYLSPMNLQGYTIALQRATLDDEAERVTVSIPYSNVSLVGQWFGTGDYLLTATSSMRKEAVD